MANRLILNGVDYSNDISGLENDLQIEYGLNSTNTVTYSISQQMEADGALAKVIEERYYENCHENASLDGQLIIDKCNDLVIPVTVTRAATEISPYDCGCLVTIKSKELEDSCYNYLDSTLIMDNDFHSYRENHPRVYYVNQPNFVVYVLFLFRFLIIPLAWIICQILNILGKIVGGPLSIISKIVDAVGDLIDAVIPGEDNIPDLSFEVPSLDCDAIGDTVDNFISGNGRYSVTYLIRDILTFHAGNCGLTFESSIFNNPASPYYNTTLFTQTLGEFGREDENINLTEEPLETVIQLLEKLTQAFPHTDYRIAGGVLYFEKNEWFRARATEIFDLDKEVRQTDIKPKFTFEQKDLCAYGKYTYTKDAQDTEGNRMVGSGRPYTDIVEYNDPPSEHQKGACERISPFGGARFMFDQLSYQSDLEDRTFKLDDNIDKWRSGRNFGGLLQTVGLALSGFFGLTVLRNQGVRRYRDLIMSGDAASQAKLLILEDGFNPLDANIVRKKIADLDGIPYYIYNYPMYFQEELPAEHQEEELWNRFAKEDDPRSSNSLMKMKDISTPREFCDRVNQILDNKGNIYVSTPYGRAYPEKYIFDINNCTIEYQNFRVICKA